MGNLLESFSLEDCWRSLIILLSASKIAKYRRLQWHSLYTSLWTTNHSFESSFRLATLQLIRHLDTRIALLIPTWIVPFQYDFPNLHSHEGQSWGVSSNGWCSLFPPFSPPKTHRLGKVRVNMKGYVLWWRGQRSVEDLQIDIENLLDRIWVGSLGN